MTRSKDRKPVQRSRRRAKECPPETETPTPGAEAALEESGMALAAAEPPAAASDSPERKFPIVGVGASAGGLTAFEEFFAAMPPDTESGMAVVLVQHLDPGHKSILTDLVRTYTRMRVYEVEDGMLVEPNCTYIIPPNRDLALLHGRLHLMEPSAPRGLRLPIDFFFRSLAEDRGEQAICIVLSGTGTDGTLGLKAVKEAGGMVMVQESESAAYNGMPRSAIATGLADYVLPPKQMPAQLIAYVQHAFGRRAKAVAAPLTDPAQWLPKITVLLRSQTGHDFSCYKQTTVRRRVERRMAVHQIERIDHYVQYLRQNPAEVEVLFRDLLIGVTGFFRDPEAFEVLQKQAIPRIFADRPAGAPVRVWVPGCSTGEEAYSIAILLREHADRLGRDVSIQVFATDIDHEAIETARAAVYPSSIVADVAAERLTRFFSQEGDNFYRIKKAIRDLLVFAEQDVLRDPPFSRLHLISCRNLLIYLEPEMQKRLVPLFHGALHSGGFLVLGSSETTGEFLDLFEVVDRKWKLYQRKEGSLPRAAEVVLTGQAVAPGEQPPAQKEEPRERRVGAREATERALLQKYAPACVAVNDKGDILYVHGRTGKYLELPPGEMSVNVLRGAREGLRLELATALRKVAARREPVRYEGLKVRTNGGVQVVNLAVTPAHGSPSQPPFVLVIFEDVPEPPEGERPAVAAAAMQPDDKDQHIATLEHELHIKEEYLQTTIEELETANEELKSTNEELQSTNEELQSANEELETSKEELQSVNEELVTVNTELQQKIEGLSRANNDMGNLLAGTGIGTVFVDHRLRIQRFTPAATRIINLIQTDIGRPVSHIVPNLVNYEHLVQDVKTVLETLVAREAEVQTTEGQWYLMRVLPYRTTENVIEGAVLTFVEITEQKCLRETLRESEERYRRFFECVNDAVLVADPAGRILDCNQVALQRYGYKREELVGMSLSDLAKPEQRAAVADYQAGVLAGSVVTAEFEHCSRDGRVIPVEVSSCATRYGGEAAVLSAARDITERKRETETRQRSEERLRLIADAAGMGTWDMDVRSGAALWSEVQFRLLGYEPVPDGHATLEMWRSRVHPDDLERVMESLERAKRDGSLFHPQHRIIRADDGAVVWLRVFGRFLYEASGQPYRFVGISFGGELDQGFEAAMTRLGAALRDAADAITVQDFEGRFLAWNPAAERLYGWSEQEALGMNARELIPEDQRAEVAAIAERLARGETVEALETRRVTKAGQIVAVRLSVTPLLDARGRPYAVATTERDITGRASS